MHVLKRHYTMKLVLKDSKLFRKKLKLVYIVCIYFGNNYVKTKISRYPELIKLSAKCT